MSTSAYMIAHCDDDYLSQAIDSVIDHVDELIFVDGAYEWVAPFLPDVGIDPERSWPSTHDILRRYGKKIRYFSGLWRDELHKREFGFAQCRGDVIIRIDADEIFTIDAAALREFRRGRQTVADMEFPYMVTEDLQRLEAGHTETPRQVCMFKRKAFKRPLDHCGYLWLVLTDEERERCKPADWKQLFHRPVSRTAHITALRTPRTSVNRARFYILQHIRATGLVPFGIEVEDHLTGDERIRRVLDYLGAEDFAGYLEGNDIVSGFAHMTGFVLAPYDLAEPAKSVVRAAVARHGEALAERLKVHERPCVMASNMPALLNISAVLDSSVRGINLTFGDEVVAASGHLSFLLADNDTAEARRLRAFHTHAEGCKVHCTFEPVTDTDVLQSCMVLLTQAAPDRKVTRLVDIEVLRA